MVQADEQICHRQIASDMHGTLIAAAQIQQFSTHFIRQILQTGDFFLVCHSYHVLLLLLVLHQNCVTREKKEIIPIKHLRK